MPSFRNLRPEAGDFVDFWETPCMPFRDFRSGRHYLGYFLKWEDIDSHHAAVEASERLGGALLPPDTYCVWAFIPVTAREKDLLAELAGPPSGAPGGGRLERAIRRIRQHFDQSRSYLVIHLSNEAFPGFSHMVTMGSKARLERRLSREQLLRSGYGTFQPTCGWDLSALSSYL